MTTEIDLSELEVPASLETEDLSAREQLELKALEDSLGFPAKAEANLLTFQEIYAAVLLNGEIIITVPAEVVDKVKQGLKNFKAKQAIRDRDNGVQPDSSTLSFKVASSSIVGAVDMRVSLTSKNLIPIIKLQIPDQTF